MLRTLLPFLIILPAMAYSIISLVCGLRFFIKKQNSSSQSTAPNPQHPAVTIIKPVKGMDEDSYANFASFCNQDYDGAVQILFALASPDDPVIPVIRQLILDFHELDIELLVNPAIHGANYKVSNLINAFPRARHDILIVCDSDIRVSPDYLRSVTAHFANPKVGLVTSLYRTSNVRNIATALEATGFTSEMIPNVMVAWQLEGLTFALGASMAIRRKSLADIGGFESLADYLADDYHLGNKIHHAGWDLALDKCFVESMVKAESLPSVLARQLRWARTMRVSRLGGYFASGITLHFPGMLLAALIAPSIAVTLAAIAFLYAVRLIIAIIFSRFLVRDNLLPRWLWLVPLRDMLAFFTWALAFLGNRVEWRGNHFRLKTGGKIEELG